MASAPALHPKHRTTRRPAAAVAVAAAAAVVMPVIADPSGYVPDTDCAACHRAIWASYQHVGMARSMFRGTPDAFIATLDDEPVVLHEPTGRAYHIERRGDEVFLSRSCLDDAGGTFATLDMRIDWIVGSGNHAQTFLHQTPSGELFELPLSWYRADGWAMSPGFEDAAHEGFGRRATRECIFCHTAVPPSLPGADHLGAPPVFPDDLPRGTGCQRCHGPGAAHVRLANDLDVDDDAVRASIVNPGRLPDERLDDVCAQCHFQPSTRFSSVVRRLGRGTYDFRPGADLAASIAFVDAAPATPDDARFEVNHHTYRLHLSRCWTESRGALHCTTCHDPHHKAPAEVARATARTHCRSCHAPDACGLDPSHPPAGAADVAPDDCIACHMPPARPEDAPHTRMTDHFIRAAPSLVDDGELPRREPPRPTDLRLVRSGDTIGDAERSILLAMVGFELDVASGYDVLDRAVREAAPSDPDAWMFLGLAAARTGRHADALDAFDRVLARRPDDVRARRARAESLARMNRVPEALAILDAVIVDAPNDADAVAARGALRIATGRREDALRDLDRALELRPPFPVALLNRGRLHAQNRDFVAAASDFARCIAVDPTETEAYLLHGRALRHEGRYAEAIATWRHGLRGRPGDVGLSLHLAATLVGAPDAAARSPADALSLSDAGLTDPRHRALVVLVRAVAMLDLDRPDEALDLARQAPARGADPTTSALLESVALARRHEDDAGRACWRRAAAQLDLRPTDALLRARAVAMAQAAYDPPSEPTP